MSELSELLQEFEYLGSGYSNKARSPGSFGKMDRDGFIDVSSCLGPGIYGLVLKDKIIYIGRAKVLINRLYTHFLLMRRKQAGKRLPLNGPGSRARAFIFDGLRLWPCDESDLYRVEKEMIARYKPRHNIQSVPVGKLTLEQVGFDFTRLGLMVSSTPVFRRRL